MKSTVFASCLLLAWLCVNIGYYEFEIKIFVNVPAILTLDLIVVIL